MLDEPRAEFETPAHPRDLSLNPEQRAAVEHPAGPLLVVAGAGSGKTRVLTARVAWLLANGVRPESILAFTFTNRAAREMRERIERVAGDAARSLWVGTFHATAVRLLRREAATLGIARDFAIYDREDQETVIREVMRRLEIPDGSLRPALVLNRISDAKNALAGPAEMERTAMNPQSRTIARCFALYQEELRRDGALDFDDLIGEAVRLFRDHPDTGRRYAQRFEHVLVDEYQDTNHAQFRLVESLAAVHRTVFAVGDDDQSIYGWRGAQVAHILDFEESFPGASVLRLEQNYRSTGRILEAANAVIAHNRSRKGKNLWCEREEGHRLRFLLTEDEADEARRVREVLAQHVGAGGRLSDCAVLYRTNAQSRALETELRKNLIPYEIVGGVPFYQRREVKDLLAYLRVVVNPADAVAFWRIWNTPRRGLGPVLRAQVEERMAATGVTALEGLRAVASLDGMARPARTGSAELLGLIDELTAEAETPVDAVLTRVIERTRYLEHLAGEEDHADRLANVQELVAAAAGFVATRLGSARDFLAEAALVSDADLLDERADHVLLLTAHNAKGLEFPVVIVTGLEEGLMPHANSIEKAETLEEERRLFYVALTRAQERVVLTAAAFRRRGSEGPSGGAVSRFVSEIPADLIETEDRRRPREERPRPSGGWGDGGARSGFRGTGGWGGAERKRETARDGERRYEYDADAPAPSPSAVAGREVYHDRFGRGVVIGGEGRGDELKYTVRFDKIIKKVLARFLKETPDGD